MNVFSLESMSDLSLFFLRASIGSIFLYHGIKKLHYWKLHHTEQLSVGWLALWRMLSIIELVGGGTMLVGFFPKIAALFFVVVMVGALYFKIYLWKKRFGGDGGWELDLVLLAASLVVFIIGGGNYSLDAFLR